MRLSVDLYKTTKSIKAYTFRDQITHSGLSITTNIAEGYERGSLKDSIRFLYIAEASCGELRTQIYIGQEVVYITPDNSINWIDETRVISKQLASLIKVRRSFMQKVV